MLRSRSVSLLAVALLHTSALVSAQPPATDVPATGQLLIVTEPAGAAVTVDGRDVGTSPATVADLLPGSHLVIVTWPDGRRADQVADVEAGRSALVRMVAPAAPPAPGPAPDAAAGAPSPPVATPPVATAPSPVDAPTAAPGPAAPSASTVATAPSSAPLAPSELEAEPAAEEPEQGVVRRNEPFEATGFPGLIGSALGVELVAALYFVSPSDPRVTGTPANARVVFDWAPAPSWALLFALDTSTGGLGGGVAINMPSWLPLSYDVAIAIQPRLELMAHWLYDGIGLSGTVLARLAISPFPHFLLIGSIGVDVTGVIDIDSQDLVGGVYFGLAGGGGIEWAFY